MPKINYKAILVLPEAKPFSDLAVPNDEGELEFDVGDNGRDAEQMVSDVHADAVLLEMLYHMDDREKIILMYQILRESGYNLNHGDCAKTLSLTREHYMFLLKNVKKKAGKVLQETRQ